MIQLDHVSKSFAGPDGRVRALQEVSLAVEPGRFAAVRGPSGSGKTTLLLIAGGLLAPDAGTVRVGGQTPYALSPEGRARFRAETVGFVFQQFHLIPYLSVRDNILAPALGVRTRGNGDLGQRADALIERFGLAGRARHTPGMLSTGERQRTALARALLNRPKVLLADEPTGNLDETNAEAVLACLAEFARDGGSVLLVTHDASAAACAETAIQLRDGRLE